MFALQVNELEEETDDEDNDEVLKEKVPSEYHNYLDLFRKREGDKLPPHRPHVDHKIEFLPGKEPTFGPIYNLSVKEQQELLKYIKENLKKGFIRSFEISLRSTHPLREKEGRYPTTLR